MIEGLTLIHLPPQEKHLPALRGDIFIINTCQRTLILGFNDLPVDLYSDYLKLSKFELFVGERAYQFLLETLCGLRSRLLAESEITAQFKKAYKSYCDNADKNNLIMMVLEKLFKDAKDIRTKHLFDTGHQSYASLTKKFLLKSAPAEKILLVGPGKLSQDIVKHLSKKFSLYVTGRNPEKVEAMCQSWSIQAFPWDDKLKFTEFSHIINTIGSGQHTLFDEAFFQQWKENFPHVHNTQFPRLFIDLGSPSVIETELGSEHGVIRLENIFQEGEKQNLEKRQKIEKAKSVIEELVQNRKYSFTLNFPFGWEELHFA